MILHHKNTRIGDAQPNVISIGIAPANAHARKYERDPRFPFSGVLGPLLRIAIANATAKARGNARASANIPVRLHLLRDFIPSMSYSACFNHLSDCEVYVHVRCSIPST
jgi:hypothetical protein